MSASVLFDVICRATPPRSACTPYPPRRPTLCLSRLWESLFRKVRVKLSSQVSMSPQSSVNKCENTFLTTSELKNYMLYQQSDRWTFFLSASVLFDVICRATPSRLACTPYPPWRLTLCLSRLRQSLFRKVRVKLSSQVSMSPPSSVNKKRFAARDCGLLPKFEVVVLAFEKKSQPRRT